MSRPQVLHRAEALRRHLSPNPREQLPIQVSNNPISNASLNVMATDKQPMKKSDADGVPATPASRKLDQRLCLPPTTGWSSRRNGTRAAYKGLRGLAE